MPSPVNTWQGTLSRPWHTFQPVGARPSATTIDFSMDSISARAQCRFPGDPRVSPTGFPAVDINQHCWIQGGYRDFSAAESNELLFDGFIEDDGSKWSISELANTISMGDRLRLTQFPVGDPFFDQSPFNIAATYDSTHIAVLDGDGNVVDTVPSATNNAPDGVGWTDVDIVKDLFVRAGLYGSVDDPGMQGIYGLNVIMGQQQGIVLSNNQKPADLIAQVDQVTGCKTFATPTGPQRVATTFTPTTVASWTLREGFEIRSIENTRSIKNFYNRVIVKGLKVGGSQWISIRSAPANLPSVVDGHNLPLPYQRSSSKPITSTFSSDLIQSQDIADRLSYTLMVMGNRVERRVTVTTQFNPYVICGQTAAVYAPHVKIFSTTNGFVYGVKHSFDKNGAHTEWDIAIYDGVAGVTTAPPATVAILPPQVSGPFTDADSGQTYYSVSLDASGTWSTSYPPDQLTFAWSDNFGDNGNLPTFSFTVTTGQLGGATSTQVALTVTDPTGTSSSATAIVQFT